MTNQAKRDIRINGSGSSSGGEFDKVSINGDGTISGDVECNKFNTNGNSQVNGSIRAEYVSIHGSSDATGNVKADKVSVYGQCNVHGNLMAGELKLGGDVSVDRNLGAEFIKQYGSIHVRGNCEIENYTAKGGFHVDGLLNVGTLDLKLSWPSSASEIGGERIMVRKSTGIDMAIKSLLRIFKAVPDAMLTANVIEGDDILLESTKAAIVRGNNIEIGPDCDIDRVEYRGTYSQSPNARVNSCVQI